MDDRISDAIKEAYTHNSDDLILATLEIQHESFVDEEGKPYALRVVHNNEDLTARIETYHNIDAGQLVVFRKSAFDLSLPDKSSRVSEMKLTIDNVSTEFWTVFDMAIRYISPIVIYYREYLASRAEITAEIDPTTFDFQIQTCTASLTQIEAMGTVLQYQNKKVLNERIDKHRFPGLG